MSYDGSDYARVEREIARGLILADHPPILDLGEAIETALELVEEWDHTRDPHGWCHERPVWLTLLSAVVDLDVPDHSVWHEEWCGYPTRVCSTCGHQWPCNDRVIIRGSEDE